MRAVRGLELDAARRRVAGPRRRVGVGQVGHRARHHGSAPADGPHRGLGQRCVGRSSFGRGDAAMSRLRGESLAMIFQDPAVGADAGVLDRAADRRGDPRASRALDRGGGDGTGRGAAGARRHSRSAALRAGFPARALRRDASARDDRHGHRQRAGPDHRRRADDRPRRDGAGAGARGARTPRGARAGRRCSSSPTISAWSPGSPIA